MKIVYLTDVHLADTAPSSRSDAYADQIFEKLAEVRDATVGADLTLAGGDWYHRWYGDLAPSKTNDLVRRLIEFLRTWPTPILTIAGNHDLPPEGMAGIGRTALGVVVEALNSSDWSTPGVMTLATQPVNFMWDGADVQIVPFHWTAERDREPTADKFRCERQADTVIALTHAMIMPSKGGYHFECIAMSDLTELDADLVLVGHTHWVTPQQMIRDTLFAGPGAIARTARTPGEEERVPSYAVINVKDGEVEVEYVPLQSARPAADVFAWVEPSEPKGDLFEGYVQVLETALSVGDVSLEKVLAGVDSNLSPEVGRLVREYLSKAER